MDENNIAGNLLIPYLCITAKTSTQDCLSMHDDFIERMSIVHKAKETENTCIDDTVMSIKIKRLRADFVSELPIDSIIEDFLKITGSILNIKTPELMNNTKKILTEFNLSMKKVAPSFLNMSEEEWSRNKADLCSMIHNLLFWGMSCLKKYEKDFYGLLFFDNKMFEEHYQDIEQLCMYLEYLELTITDNDRINDLVIPKLSFFQISKTNWKDINFSLVNKLKEIENVHEVIRYSGTDECAVCDRSFTNPETRFIINDNPDCRHIICSYCMYKCLTTAKNMT